MLKTIKNEINIVLIGDKGIGKKSLVRRYVYGKYKYKYWMLLETIISYIMGKEEKQEQEHWNKKQPLSDLETDMTLNIKIISDINELHDNKSIDVIMVCYDINNEETFKNCCKFSNDISKYKNETNNKLITVLVGLKSDILNLDRKIEDKNAEIKINMDIWKKLNVNDCQCSAKTKKNVRELFLTSAEKVYDERKK